MDHRVKDAIDEWPSFRIIAAFLKLFTAAEALQCRYWTIEILLRSIRDERYTSCGHFGNLMCLSRRSGGATVAFFKAGHLCRNESKPRI